MIDNELVYLDAINKLLKSNMSELPSDLKPKTREEFYLEQIFNNLAGVSAELPTDLHPLDRKEILLAVIEQNSRNISSGGGGSQPPNIKPDDCGHVVRQYMEIIPTINIDEVGNVNHSAEIMQSKVAEDVYFGTNRFNDYVDVEHENFEYNTSVLHLDNSELVFIPARDITETIELREHWLQGYLFTLILDNTETDIFEVAKLKTKLKTIVDNNVSINPDNFKETGGYTISNKIDIVTGHNHTSNMNLVTDDETYTYVTIDTTDLTYNDITKLT